MPLYEYQCKKCKHRFEKIRKFSDRQLKKCPECGGPLEQLLSAPAVQFKGSGWYVTDYAKKAAGSAETGAASDSAKDSAGSPAKPAESADKAEKAEKTDSKKTEKKTHKK